MSSSVIVERKGAPGAPIGQHQDSSPRTRVDVLAERISQHLETLTPRGRARCLDIGCGDMSIADAVHDHATRTHWRCIDLFPFPAAGLHGDTRWNKYLQFDGHTIPYRDDHFDVALLCDVLHDIPEEAARLLAEAKRVARYVIVKDRFESGAYSRSRLRLMDFVGAGDYGSAIAKSHFTRDGFVRLAGEHGLVITSLDCGLELHEPPPVRQPMRPLGSHFIAVLRRN